MIKVTRVRDDYFVLKGGRRFHNPLTERCSCRDMECLLHWCPEMIDKENEVWYEEQYEESGD